MMQSVNKDISQADIWEKINNDQTVPQCLLKRKKKTLTESPKPIRKVLKTLTRIKLEYPKEPETIYMFHLMNYPEDPLGET